MNTRPKKQSVKADNIAVRLDPDEKRYLLEGAQRAAHPGEEMGLSTFLRIAAKAKTETLLGVSFADWLKQQPPAKRTKAGS